MSPRWATPSGPTKWVGSAHISSASRVGHDCQWGEENDGAPSANGYLLLGTSGLRPRNPPRKEVTTPPAWPTMVSLTTSTRELVARRPRHLRWHWHPHCRASTCRSSTATGIKISRSYRLPSPSKVSLVAIPSTTLPPWISGDQPDRRLLRREPGRDDRHVPGELRGRGSRQRSRHGRHRALHLHRQRGWHGDDQSQQRLCRRLHRATHGLCHLRYHADGTYLEVRDRDTLSANDADYFLDTPRWVYRHPPAPDSGPGTWNDGTGLGTLRP